MFDEVHVVIFINSSKQRHYDVEKMSAGHTYVSAKLNEMIFFVKNKDSLNDIISK